MDTRGLGGFNRAVTRTAFASLSALLPPRGSGGAPPRRKVPQLTFSLDRRLGQRAGFRRNEQFLSLKPRYVVVFAGSGVVERLVIQAKEQGLSVVDRRGPLGTHPKRAAREAAAA